MKNFEIENIDEWEQVIKYIIPNLKYNILIIKGNLGAGKTTFTKEFVKNLGSNDDVDSPTYSIVNEYECPKGRIYHFDLYRVNEVEELYDMGIDEYLERGFLSIIEWPEIYENELEGMNYHEMIIENKLDVRRINFK